LFSTLKNDPDLANLVKVGATRSYPYGRCGDCEKLQTAIVLTY